MKLAIVLLLAVALAGAQAKRDLLQQSCSVSVNAASRSQASDAISKAATAAFASCKAAGAQAACGAGCKAYADAAGQAISQAFAKAAVDVFASVSGGPGCKVNAQARGNAEAQARAVADSFALSIVQLCNGASATQWKRTVADALTRVYATAAVQVACKNGGNAQAAASVVAQSTLTAIACSISAAYSQCLCKTPPGGYVYTDTCWTGILSDASLDANAVAQSNGPDCQALVSGAGGTNTGPTPPKFPTGPGGFIPAGATSVGGVTTSSSGSGR